MTPRPLALALALPIAAVLAACSPSGPDTSAPAADDTAPPATAAPAQATPAPDAAAPAGPRSEAEQAVDASIERVLGHPDAYRQAVERLQAAVAGDDAAAVAALADYPIQVQIDGAPVTLDDERAFAERYAEFMTPGIRDAIVGTRYGDLFVNQDGVMLGSGQAWLNGICQDDACEGVDVRLVTLQPGAN